MDDFATAEEKIAFEKLREKFHEVNVVAQTNLATVQDHVNYTCQKAFFKCTYECYDRCRRMEDISDCVKNCKIPLTEAQEIFAKEKTIFQEKLNASFFMCLHKYDEAKLQQKPGALSDFISCTEQSFQESINMMPHLANKLKDSYGIKDNGSFYHIVICKTFWFAKKP